MAVSFTDDEVGTQEHNRNMNHSNEQFMISNPDWIICRAKALQRLVEELDTEEKELSQFDVLLFEGKCLAIPVILSLATEIALKAWQIRERKKPPDKSHDLLALFESLNEDTQSLLDEKMPKIPNLSVPSFSPIYHDIRSILSLNKDLFVRWRYSYESPSQIAETGLLKRALGTIVEAYDESAKEWPLY